MIGGASPAVGGGELRAFLARLLGWTNERAVDLALRSIELAANHRAALTLCGAEDPLPIAWSLHRRVLGADRPFVTCDPRRGDVLASVRSPTSYQSAIHAVSAAAGGALCVRTRRPPRDFAAAAARLRDEDDVMLILCGSVSSDPGLAVRPAPIFVPPLASRTEDLPRIIDEYARDAIAELGASDAEFTSADHAWVRERAATSLAEIEKGTLRMVAIRSSRNPSVAAARLNMAPISLFRWLGRRRQQSPHS